MKKDKDDTRQLLLIERSSSRHRRLLLFCAAVFFQVIAAVFILSKWTEPAPVDSFPDVLQWKVPVSSGDVPVVATMTTHPQSKVDDQQKQQHQHQQEQQRHQQPRPQIQKLEQADTGLMNITNQTNSTIRTTTSTYKIEPRRRGSLPKFSYYFDYKNRSLQETAQDLLNFTVIGYPKTGTTFMLRDWLPKHPDICMPNRESDSWKHGPVQLARELYNIGGRTHCIRGYKHPTQLLEGKRLGEILNAYPKSGLIVALRHPVWWMESYYNHKVRSGNLNESQPLESLRGKGGCSDECPGYVCPANAKFQFYLSLLGKTPLKSDHELSLLNVKGHQKWRRRYVMEYKIHNPVFLVESSQLDATQDAQVAEALRQDLSHFLGLGEDRLLPPQPKPVLHLPGNLGEHVVQSYPKVKGSIKICDERYKNVRNELVDIGTKAAEWILTYFIQSQDVSISSPDYFRQKLLEWQYDPCEQQEPQKQQQQ